MAMRYWTVIVAALAATGCAATYEVPQVVAQRHAVEHGGGQAAVKAAAVRVMLSRGYQITGDGDGYVSTAPKKTKLTPAEADCGTTMGLDYLKDGRTAAQVAVNVVVDGRMLSVAVTITAQYLPGDVAQGVNLQCVSRGVIERELAAAVLG